MLHVQWLQRAPVTRPSRRPESSSPLLTIFYYFILQLFDNCRGSRRLEPFALLVNRLQKPHAESSWPLTRAVRMTAALLPCCMRGCLHGCMTACVIPFTCCPNFMVMQGTASSDFLFLPLGVRERGSSAKNPVKYTWKTLQSLGKGTPRHLCRTPPMSP